jgi:hypothetical protein
MAMTAAQQAAFYFIRRRRRLANARTVVMLSPRTATIAATASVASARFMSGVTALDNNEGTSIVALSGADASDFQMTGLNLELKSGVTLSAGVPKVVSVDVTNATKGDASHLFTLTVT